MWDWYVVVYRSNVDVFVDAALLVDDADLVDAVDDHRVVDEDVDETADEDGQKVGEGNDWNDQSLLRIGEVKEETLFRPTLGNSDEDECDHRNGNQQSKSQCLIQESLHYLIDFIKLFESFENFC